MGPGERGPDRGADAGDRGDHGGKRPAFRPRNKGPHKTR
jgi:hypothetical protein